MGDTTNQKHLFNLLRFRRPLNHHFRKARVFVERKIRKTLLWRLWLYVERFGTVKGSFLFYNIQRRARADNAFSVSIPEVRTPIYLRPNTSDIQTFEQIFVSNEYEVRFNIRAKLIIDGGANVGYTTLYFANKFPEAVIIAVEPEASNAEMLRKNAASYPNVKILEAAIWNKRSMLSIANPRDDKWAFRVTECDTEERSVIAVTIEDIVQSSGHSTIDILKLDIEGAEKEVFSECGDWLDQVRVLMIEMHDDLKPGCSRTVYGALQNYNFRQSRNGTTVTVRLWEG